MAMVYQGKILRKQKTLFNYEKGFEINSIRFKPQKVRWKQMIFHLPFSQT